MGKHRLDNGSTEAWGGPNLVYRAGSESSTVQATAPSRPVVDNSRAGTDHSATTPPASGPAAGPALT